MTSLQPTTHPAYEQDGRLSTQDVAAAAFRATRLYPGPVGDLVRRELEAWLDLGWRFRNGDRIVQLVRHIMDTPLP